MYSIRSFTDTILLFADFHWLGRLIARKLEQIIKLQDKWINQKIIIKHGLGLC